MVRIVARHFLSTLTLILFVASIAAAQAPTTGRLTGTVKDPSGAIILGAAIVAKNAQTGSEFRAVTNEVGVWVMPSGISGFKRTGEVGVLWRMASKMTAEVLPQTACWPVAIS